MVVSESFNFSSRNSLVSCDCPIGIACDHLAHEISLKKSKQIQGEGLSRMPQYLTKHPCIRLAMQTAAKLLLYTIFKNMGRKKKNVSQALEGQLNEAEEFTFQQEHIQPVQEAFQPYQERDHR